MFSCIGYRTGNFHGLSAIFLLPYNFKIIIGKCRIGKSMTKREQDICFFCVIITVTDHHTFPVLHTVFLSKCSDRMCRTLRRITDKCFCQLSGWIYFSRQDLCQGCSPFHTGIVAPEDCFCLFCPRHLNRCTCIHADHRIRHGL